MIASMGNRLVALHLTKIRIKLLCTKYSIPHYFILSEQQLYVNYTFKKLIQSIIANMDEMTLKVKKARTEIIGNSYYKKLYLTSGLLQSFDFSQENVGVFRLSRLKGKLNCIFIAWHLSTPMLMAIQRKQPS
eukprot:TRINITY_DN367_c0_g1_i2.p12 TRINITY_DN367_c0_g1~~TRINITY_DN367_c0_g1_i2.p12  ORF type:complete len:132 (+),score=7.56 TRINITY_DN367_c0_g1_i2:1634-2029(+)